MSTRSIVAIWFVAIVLLIAAALLSQGSSVRGGFDQQAVPSLAPLATIDAIELERPDGHWRFERDGDGAWWQRTPFEHRMDGGRLMGIPELLQVLRAAARVELSDAQAGVTGLSKPGAGGSNLGRLRIEGEGDAVTTVHLGRTGIGGRGWIRLNDESEAMVVDDDLHALVLQEAPRAWRDRRLLPSIDALTQSISWLLDDERIELLRDGRRWTFTSPVATRASAQAVGNLIATLAGARSTATLLDDPVDPAAFGLAPPVARIEVIDARGEPAALRIGDRLAGATNDRYGLLEGTPSIVRLDQETVAALMGDPVELVDRTGSGAAPIDVHALRVLRPEGTLRLQRRLDEWVLDDGTVLDSTAVLSLLEALTSVEGSDITLVDGYPTELEQAVVVLEGRDGHPIDTVRVLQEPVTDGVSGRWGLENGDGVIRILPEGTWLALDRGQLGG